MTVPVARRPRHRAATARPPVAPVGDVLAECPSCTWWVPEEDLAGDRCRWCRALTS